MIPRRINGKYNPEYDKHHYQKHKEKIKKRYKERYWNNPEQFREYNRNHHGKCTEAHRRASVKWRKNNPEKRRVHNLIGNHPKLYSLDSECVFCGSTENLEHGHLDYEDEGFNYLTVCAQCNSWMSKPPIDTVPPEDY